MTLSSVVAELTKFGINIDTDRLKEFYPTSAELAQLEDYLLRLLRMIEAHNRVREKLQK